MPASPSTTRPPSSRPELGACFHHVHLSALSASLVMGRGLDRAAAGISRLQSSCPVPVSLSESMAQSGSPGSPGSCVFTHRALPAGRVPALGACHGFHSGMNGI